MDIFDYVNKNKLERIVEVFRENNVVFSDEETAFVIPLKNAEYVFDYMDSIANTSFNTISDTCKKHGIFRKDDGQFYIEFSCELFIIALTEKKLIPSITDLAKGVIFELRKRMK